MSEREPLGPDERRAADEVRGLAAVHPEPGYRARLRHEFVTGTLGSPWVAGTIDPPARGGWRVLLAPAAAAALMVAGLLFNRGPGWQVLEVHGTGSIEVDGREVALSSLDELGRAIRNGGRFHLPPDVSMTVTAPGRMAVEITPETDAELSAPPARWLGRIASAEVLGGELRITTGERFHGSRLEVTTPEAKVEVRGTTLAVIREPTGTCVCVMDGLVRVGARGQPMVDVPAGRRRYVFRDGRSPEQADMREVERVKLGEMMEHHPAR